MTKNRDLGVITIDSEETYRQRLVEMERERESAPQPKDTITNAVIEDLHSRADRGWKKYNTTLGQNNVDDFLQHLYEELLDASQYIKKEIITRKTFYDLTKQYPNDQELGAAVRKFFSRDL
jgi:hypothetical protein